MSRFGIHFKASQQVGTWTGATVGTPLFPPTLGAATATDTTLSLAFTAPTAGATPTNYQYALSTDGGTTYGSYNSIGSTSSPISITGLSTNTTYSIRLRSYLTATTQFSDYAETSFNTVPSAPTSLAATATSTTSISISFSQVAGTNTITNYEYAVSSTSASAGFGSWTAFSPVDATSPVVIGSLTAGTQYWAKLRAVTAFVTGIESSTANTYTLPEAPTSVTVSTTTSSTQNLTFSQTGTVTNYKYALSTNAGVSYGAFTALSPADATSPITITGLTAATSYYVKIKAVNASGDSAESNAVSFSTPNPVSTVSYIMAGGGGYGGFGRGGPTAGGGGGGGTVAAGTSAVVAGATYTVAVAGAAGTTSTSGTSWSGGAGYGGGTGGESNGGGGGGYTGGGGSCDGGGSCGGGGAGSVSNGGNGRGGGFGCSAWSGGGGGAGGSGSGYGGGAPSNGYGGGGYGVGICDNNIGGCAGGVKGCGGGGSSQNGVRATGDGGGAVIKWSKSYATATSYTGGCTYSDDGTNHVYTFSSTGTITI
jgi:hypothetical protein